jgi:iron(III) transport system substrate-binding protein
MVVLPQAHRLTRLRSKAAQFKCAFDNAKRRGVRRSCAAFSLCILLSLVGCKQRATREVIVYASQDQVYAEPMLNEFTRSTGIKVRAVYDSEAVKTVGLVNRLLREASNPQCDLFWNNEELRTRQLAARGILRETNAWGAIGYRSRRIVINTNLVPTVKGPSSLASLTNAEWRGKIALAYPLFGTTGTHFLALRQQWGPQQWESWGRALHANKPLLLEGNSMVVNFVGRGEAWIGLTDSDDIAAGQRSGLPIAALPLTAESLLIPNTVALIRGSRNADAADELRAFLQRPETLERLIAAGALEGSQAPQGGLTVDWATLLNDLDSATDTLRAIFVR